LGNVVGNAIKFTSKGKIVVEVSHQDQDIIVKVQDTGPGIPQAQLESIFEEFRQAHSSNAGIVGTGLGLSISRRLLQMHGGSIHAESTLGEGSTFVISIPTEVRARVHSAPAFSLTQDPIINEI